MHASLDGFVAGPKGEMDWIQFDNEMFRVADNLTGQSDAVIYGRVTWEMMEAYWPTAGDKPNASEHSVNHSRWYNSVNKIVASRSLKDKQQPRTRFIGENLSDEIAKLKIETGSDILLIGSPSIVHEMLAADLIDDLWLFTNPILLGEGIPLFRNVTHLQKLRLESSKAYPCGVVCNHYSFKTED